MMWPRDVPEGELYLKRSAICLVKKDSPDGLDALLSHPETPPKDAFYLYTDNCSDKEDLYFALIRATKGFRWNGYPEYDPTLNAKALHYSDTDMLTLINDVQLHNDDPHSKWMSALLGRWFLAIKDTDLLSRYLHKKATSKLERIKRPSYLGPVSVQRITCGSSVPHFSRLRVRELSAEGNVVIEANVRYGGGVAVEIATKASLALSSRFNPDISLVLAVALKSLEGKLVLKMKPPPSNRIWYAFETMPSMALQIEPVVSSKQVKIKYITNQIESKIREVFKETLVLPFMDDISLYDTEPDFYRGGIWDRSAQPDVMDREADVGLDGFEELSIQQEAVSYVTSREDADDGLRRRRASTFSTDADSDITSVLDLDEAGAGHRSDSTRLPGDLKGFGYTPEGARASANAGPSGASGAVKQQTKNLVGTVKKWSNWYFKEKMRGGWQQNANGEGDQQVGGASNSPIQAPLPHTFPPEVLSLINGTNDPSRPYQAAPEMTLPKAYPAPIALSHRKSVSNVSADHVSSAANESIKHGK
jgi:hypothetical protein